MNHPEPRAARGSARVGPCLLTAAATALLLAISISLPALAGEARAILILHGPDEAEIERVEELRLALVAHLSDTSTEPRLHELPRTGSDGYETADLERTAREQRAGVLVWLGAGGDELHLFDTRRDREPRVREVPDYDEGWASRCEAMATIIASDLAAADDVAAPDERSWLIGLAPRIGLGIPTSKLGPAVIAGIGIDFFLPVLERRLVLSADLSIARPEHEGAGTDPRVGGDYEYSLTVMMHKVAVDVVFRFFERQRRIVPFVGGGPALQVVSTTERTSFDSSQNEERSVEFGGELLGGADLRLGPGALFLELRVVMTGLDQRLTGRTNGGVASLAAGYRFVF